MYFGVRSGDGCVDSSQSQRVHIGEVCAGNETAAYATVGNTIRGV
jgi:hypothetical protein